MPTPPQRRPAFSDSKGQRPIKAVHVRLQLPSALPGTADNEDPAFNSPSPHLTPQALRQLGSCDRAGLRYTLRCRAVTKPMWMHSWLSRRVLQSRRRDLGGLWEGFVAHAGKVMKALGICLGQHVTYLVCILGHATHYRARVSRSGRHQLRMCSKHE